MSALCRCGAPAVSRLLDLKDQMMGRDGPTQPVCEDHERVGRAMSYVVLPLDLERAFGRTEEAH